MLKGVVLILIVASAFGTKPQNENPIVETPMGRVKGSILTTLEGKLINAFRGIRYAVAPVGKLRFQPPVPVLGWEGIYDATDDGPVCPQPRITPSSEDCLFLNVYTTKLPEKAKNPKRPVIVYIHAGGFYSSAGSSFLRGPQYFLDQDIVLVTINYRLGSLGFLSTGDELAPGNNGLKDQVVALKWVKENIEAFGGDRDSITISGYSAGGTSVSLHMLSPMSRGLFHKSIIMSDAVYGQSPIYSHQFNLAQKQARLVGCPDDNSTIIINCLKSKSAEEIAGTLRGFAEFRFDPILVWMPVIEPDFGQERFLAEHPIRMAMKGDFMKIPVMLGVTKDEFAGPAVELSRNATDLKEMDDNFETVAPIVFMYERDTESSKHISRELKKFYFGDVPLTNNSLTGLTHLYADSVTGFPINRATKLMATYNNKNVYYYCFTYQGRYSYYYWPGTQTPFGVVHHDDLIYLFYISTRFPKFNLTSPEYKMVKKLTTLLANFARTSNPTPESNNDLDHASWLPFTTDNNKYMDIGDKLIMKQNLYEDRYKLWEKLFPLSDY